MTHRLCVPHDTGRTYAPLVGAETSGAMMVAPNTVPPTKMASQPTSREGDSAVGRTVFAQYLQKVAYAEVERASDRLRADAFALADPDRMQVPRDVSLRDLRDDLQDVECAVRFLELAEEMEGQ